MTKRDFSIGVGVVFLTLGLVLAFNRDVEGLETYVLFFALSLYLTFGKFKKG